MKVLKKMDNVEYKYDLVFLVYGYISENIVLEITYNWGKNNYDHGNAIRHLCMQVDAVYKTCEIIEQKGGVITRPSSQSQ